MKLSKFTERIIALGLLLVASSLLVAFFERLPIEGTSLAIDWRDLWMGIQGGIPTYGTGLRNPPWSLLPILPLGFFSFRTSWGLITLITLGTLIVSVPRSSNRNIRWLSIILLVTSFPSMRHTADGNFEGLVIAGILLVLHGYRTQNPCWLAAGILLATAKIQETWLLMAALSIYVFETWSARRWIASGLIMALVIVPCMLWLGRDWLEAMMGIPQRGSIMDISLSSVLGRLSVPFWIMGGLWVGMVGATLYTVLTSNRSLSREKATMLISASLLLSPYAAGNNFLTVLAIGIIPLFQSDPLIGTALIVLTNLPYLASRDISFWWSAYYWAILLVLTWSLFMWRIYRMESRQIVAPH